MDLQIISLVLLTIELSKNPRYVSIVFHVTAILEGSSPFFLLGKNLFFCFSCICYQYVQYFYINIKLYIGGSLALFGLTFLSGHFYKNK